eukprot:m.277977 g.277977  ORF g.277977 m.277977 type:complete len:158 (-) comp22876_c3_seq30:21-494(-)
MHATNKSVKTGKEKAGALQIASQPDSPSRKAVLDHSFKAEELKKGDKAQPFYELVGTDKWKCPLCAKSLLTNMTIVDHIASKGHRKKITDATEKELQEYLETIHSSRVVIETEPEKPVALIQVVRLHFVSTQSPVGGQTLTLCERWRKKIFEPCREG